MISCKTEESTNMITKVLNSNWSFKEINGSHSGKATVPGTIHTDLLKNKLIEDPFYRVNEKKQQWIDKKDWEYTTVFNISTKAFNKSNIILDFKGLDTYADVYLNDSLVLKANNMFREWKVDIKKIAKLKNNHLRVLLHSPIQKGLEELKNHYLLPATNDQSENGGLKDKKVSPFTRKAGYHYGWDWGPRFVTSGIWRPIVFKAWDKARIEDVFIKQPSVTRNLAQLVVEVSFQVDADFSGILRITNNNTKEQYVDQVVQLKKGRSKVLFQIAIKNPKLWWSNGLGNPNLYCFNVELLDKSKKQLAFENVTTGLRSLKLVRNKDEFGESFLFELNGNPVFIKGANYIPNDSFVTSVTDSDYKKVIQDAVDANMNMLRVWGGGIYEYDKFYDLCDQNGMLVWQDFMFACTMYPGDDAFLANVKQEAIDNVIRLRNHPSIALWCGNNEINTAWQHYSDGGWGWKNQYSLKQQEEIQNAYLAVFQEIIPNVIKKYTDGDDYWPSSPQAGYEPEKHAGYESTSGDMHYWGVWHGKHHFEDFYKYKARFMSEYGFQSFPDIETVKKYALPKDFNIESEVMASHQRSGIGNLRIKEYMSWDYNIPKDFNDFLYMSQVLQAQGIKIAIEAHRSDMPYCMGTMYWQLNDCWPVASWSSTDYYHKWKALHYIVKKAYQPILLVIKQVENKVVVHGVSDLLKDTTGELKLMLIDFNGEVIISISEQIVIKKNTSTKIFEIDKQKLLGKANLKSSVLKVEFLSGKKSVSENLYYFEKPKNLLLEIPSITSELIVKDNKEFLKIRTNKLIKSLYVKVKNQEVFLTDNYFDLLPNQEKIIGLISDENIDLSNLEYKYIVN